jgi:hypothetical protein
MVEVAPAEQVKAVNIGFSATPAVVRLIEELAIKHREFNKSRLLRMALAVMADRDLDEDWRELVDWDAA